MCSAFLYAAGLVKAVVFNVIVQELFSIIVAEVIIESFILDEIGTQLFSLGWQEFKLGGSLRHIPVERPGLFQMY